MRLHVTFALLTALLLFLTLRGGNRHRFSFIQVAQIAEQRARREYVPLPNSLPPQLQHLSPLQEAAINWKDAFRLWRKNGLPFQVDFYHISREFPSGPRINTVDHKGSHALAYSPTFFDFGGISFNPPLPTTLPYAGFYLRYPLPTATATKPNLLNGFFTTQGASYFRVLAQDQVYGLSARALAINTGLDDKTPEEFPQFTDIWLYQPAASSTQLYLDAIIDSPSVVGAYDFKIRPGPVTSIDVHAKLFFRRDVVRLGIAPFSSMFLYGENGGNHFGDTLHAKIHDSDGVIVHNSKDVWMWRPFQQTPFLQVYDFDDENPKGFGVIQRDRDFHHYQDLQALYNVRPSVWVTPRGTWGKGAIQITQLPTNNTNTDNVVAFWRPDKAPKAGDRMEVDYTLDFYMNDATRPPLAYCESTFVNVDPQPPEPPPAPANPPSPSMVPPPALPTLAAPTKPTKDAKSATPKSPAPPAKPVPPATTPVQFLVDFKGSGIENLPANSPPDLDLVAIPAGTGVRDNKVEKNGYDNSWRVTFTILPFKKHVPTELKARLLPHDTLKKSEAELTLIHAEIDRDEALLAHGPIQRLPGAPDAAAEWQSLRKNILPLKEKALQDAEAGEPLSETWTYTWHQ